MKTILFLSLVSFNLSAAVNWTSVGETENCPQKIEVFAKDGEKFVEVAMNGKRTKLFSVDKTAYSAETPRTTEFTSLDKATTYLQPSMTEGNPPKLSFVSGGSKEICKLTVK